MAFLLYAGLVIIDNMVLENRQFFAQNWSKSPKIGHHNVDL
jgi:hypothetical protein